MIRMLKNWMAIGRLLLFALVMIVFVLRFLILTIFSRNKLRLGMKHRKQFLQFMFPVLGIRIQKTGEIPSKTVLFVCNHISYLDPTILLKYTYAMPVSKSEVSSWPLIGYGVARSGTLFVDRSNRSSRKDTLNTILHYLQSGQSIINYPEGTTGSEFKTMEFKPGSFVMAADNNIPVCPVTIAFNRKEAAFVDDDRFLSHFLGLFSYRKNHAFIHFGECISMKDGKELMQYTKDSIDRMLRQLKEKVVSLNASEHILC